VNTIPQIRQNQNQNRQLNRLFASIAPWYDLLNHSLSLGLDFYWRKRLIDTLHLRPKQKILDIACGTFDLSIAACKRNPEIIVYGLDYTLDMLKTGKTKIKNFPQILPLQGDGKFLPFADNSLDKVMLGFGIRNIPPYPKTLKEIFRVLKPGGSLHILEFGSGRQRIWKGLYNFYLQQILPLIGGIVSRDKPAYTYLAQTISQFPLPRDFAQIIYQTGFTYVTYFPLSSGIVYIHLAQKPI